MRYAAAACLAILAPAVASAERWAVQYFYDQDRSTLSLEDLAFPSAQRGIAVGTIYEQYRNPRFTVLTSSDGGEHWSMQPLGEHPRSLFFLNDSMGWMVTDKGIWFTEESGRGWKKISAQKKPDRKLSNAPRSGLIERVWFLDPRHGFAAGLQKTVLETQDGGRTWTAVEEAAKPSANPSFTAYNRIAFDGPRAGLIVGGSTPRQVYEEGRLPLWMEPERVGRRYQVPSLMILMQTTDAGAHWTATTAPLFGNVTSLRLAAAHGLAVFGFEDGFEWPSEVYRIDLSNGQTQRIFREKNRRVVDGALFAGPRAFLAAVEPSGQLASSPNPNKVKILTSTNFTDWNEMDVDYKAVARSLILAGPDPEHMWCATDTGMILRLVR